MSKLFIKILLAFILLIMPFMYVSNAEYIDNESSFGNTFSATSLDLELQDENDIKVTDPFFEIQKLKKDKEVEKEMKAVNVGEISFTYFAKYEFINGDEDVCAATNLKVEKDNTQIYDGLLSDFDLTLESAPLTGSEDNWKFILKNENDDSSIQGENCEFNLKFMAFQDNSNTGFSDEETLENQIIFPFEPTISLFHNTVTHQLEISLGNLTNFLSFDFVLDYDTDTVSDHVENSGSFSGETNKIIEIDLGTESGGVVTPYPNPHDFMLDIEFTDINSDIINYLEEL